MTTPTIPAPDYLTEFKIRMELRLDKWKLEEPSDAEWAAALAALGSESLACGRCGWACTDPRAGSTRFQQTMHAIRHREIESMWTGGIVRTYRAALSACDLGDLSIAQAELQRRGAALPTE